MGLLSLHLGLEQLKDNDQVKHYISSSLFYHCSRVFISFQNKTQRFYCMTLSSLSIYVVFIDPHQGNKDVMPFSLPTTKAFVEFIGREKARAYLQCIYCKVKQWIQRELSYTIKSRCACVWIYGGYIWWLILILLCSKTYLSFGT
jgi:hypothetical protein